MKHMRKLLAMVLAVMMVMSLATTAFADETYTITLDKAQPGHTYTAYQIFIGDLSDGVLSNIIWGANVSEAGKTALGDAATVAADLETVTDAEAFAETIDLYLQSPPAGSVKIGDNATTGTISGLEAGYYLIKTTDTTEESGVYTKYIMKVVANITAEVKADAPELEKTANTTDVNIGDTITYTLTATMPTTLAGYETYTVIFNDTLSDGLDFIENSVSVTVDGQNATNKFDIAITGRTMTVSCEDVRAFGVDAGDEIIVTYQAALNEDAVIAGEGNPNKAHLDYSNDPQSDSMGKTPPPVVKVYTWKIPVFKYTGDEETPLEGAGFTLYKDEACNEAVDLVATDDTSVYTVCTQTGCNDHEHVNEVFTDNTGYLDFNGLAQGTYYLKETTTPAGYNTCDVIAVTIGENGALTQNSSVTQLVKVRNNAGAELPETGGMGTTLFYVFGGIMMLAAVVLLVTKKRMADIA